VASAIRFAILGLASGGVYTLLALGVIVIYRASGAVNFANAAIAVGSGYALFYFEAKGIPTALAIVLAVIAGLIFGLLVQLIVMRPLRSASALTKAIATLGILVVVQSGCQLKFGSNPQLVPAFLPQDGVRIFGAHLTVDYIIIFGVSILLSAVLWWVFRVTRIGLATAALAENEEALNALGWSSSVIARGNWALAGALAALAGILVAPLDGLSLPNMTTLLIPALAAALFGGLSSFPAATVGAMFIGVVQSELTFYGSEPVIRSFPNLSDAVPFLVIIVILMIRGKSLPARDYVGARLPRLGSGRLSPTTILTSLIVAVVLIQFVFPIEWVAATTSCLIAAILLLSLVILTGLAGQLSLAQLSIAGLGALAAARLVAAYGWPVPPAALVGIAVAIPIGVIIGLPAVRTRGVTLAVVTLGLAAALNALVFSSTRLTGGQAGIDVGSPSVFGVEIDETTYPRRFSLVALALFVVMAIIVRNIRRSGAGRRFIAVRSNERAAAAMGINIARTKLHAFVLSSIVATIGGILIAFRYPTALFDNFDPFQSVNYVVEAVIGGVGYVGGAVAGTGIEPSGLGNKVVSSIGLGKWLQFIGGLLLLITVILNPDGIAGSVVQQLAPIIKRLRRKGRGGMNLAAVNVDDLVRTEPTVLSVSGLTVKFGGVVAVDNVSLELRDGEILGVIGPNGAGKTTLVDAITGYVVATGRITLDDRPMGGLAAHKRSRAGITRSFQSLELFEELSVGENLMVASEHHGRANDLTSLVRPGRLTLEAAAVAVVQDFSFNDSLDLAPADLTYGQRRLLGISRAVASHPRVLMLDEPAAGLDDHDRGELKILLRRLAETWKIAVLLIEHDVELVMSVSDRVLALEFGKVIAEGAPNDVRRHPEVVRSYLGVDDVPANAAALPPCHAVPSPSPSPKVETQ